jgi:homoserine O-acetyltransferase
MLMQGAGSMDVEVPLPGDLAKFGGATTARISGNPSGPLIVALGGISGNRFVCYRSDGGGGWWPGLVGPDCAIDPAHHRVLGLDFAADPAGERVPSTKDQARVLLAALDAVGADRAHVIIGASYGGMVALAFGEMFPKRVGKLVVISGGAEPHPAATASRDLQRRVVALGMASGRGREALSIARGMAMMTYRTSAEFAHRFRGGIVDDASLARSEPGDYLGARGEAFLKVMTPERFLSLSASVDRHQVVPSKIKVPALLIGAKSDLLVPPEQMIALAAAMPRLHELHLLDSLYGHDMFLKEATVIGELIQPFLGDLS